MADRLFLRHELLKVKDVQRNTPGGLESLRWASESRLGEFRPVGQLKGRVGPGAEPGMSEYVMGDAVPAQGLNGRRRGKQRAFGLSLIHT